MYSVFWAYEVRPDRLAEFEELYATGGGWSRLFRGSDQYLGTELYRDVARPTHYLTMDRWTSRSAYEGFLQTVREPFRRLDEQGEGLTVEERRVGAVED